MLILSNEVVICNSLDIARILGAPKMTYAIDAAKKSNETIMRIILKRFISIILKPQIYKKV